VNYHRDGFRHLVDVGPFRIEIVPSATGYRADYALNGSAEPNWRRLGFYANEDDAMRIAPRTLAGILRGVVQRLEEP